MKNIATAGQRFIRIINQIDFWERVEVDTCQSANLNHLSSRGFASLPAIGCNLNASLSN